jgi:hypothetical protein
MRHQRLSFSGGGKWAVSRHACSDGWLWGDLFFLQDALAHGMSVAQVATFLGRTVDEVRAKADLIDEGPRLANHGRPLSI